MPPPPDGAIKRVPKHRGPVDADLLRPHEGSNFAAIAGLNMSVVLGGGVRVGTCMPPISRG
jgi:hypothetical protein